MSASHTSAIRLIVEGHSMSKKTTLIDHWRKHHPNFTALSGEWRTPFGIPLMCTEGRPVDLPADQLHKAYDTILNMLELFPEQTFVFNRFHISQQFFDKMFHTQYYDASIEKRLEKMNTAILYLRNDFDSYNDALKDRLSKYPASRFPLTLEEYREQERVFRDVLHKSNLPYIEYDVTMKPIEQVSEEVFEKLRKIHVI